MKAISKHHEPAWISAAAVIMGAMITTIPPLLFRTSGSFEGSPKPGDPSYRLPMVQPAYYSADSRPPVIPALGCCAIDLISPQTGSLVDMYEDVRYRVAGQPPGKNRPVLFVRDSLGQYWSWGDHPDGIARRVQFGQPPDSGKEFEIAVLITDLNVPMGVPSQLLPPSLVSMSVIVRRR